MNKLVLLTLIVSAISTLPSEYDTDEFELAEVAEVKNEAIVEEQIIPDVINKVPEPEKHPDKIRAPIGALELIFGSVISVYLLAFFIGIHANRKRANNWFTFFKSQLEQQFVVLGKYEAIQTESTEELYAEVSSESSSSSVGSLVSSVEKMDMESFSRYVLCATGRRNCVGARFAIDLKHRQDLVSMAMSLFTSEQDTLTIDFFLSSPAGSVLCVCAPKLEKTLRENATDLNVFTKRTTVSGIDDLVVLAECPEEIVHYYFADFVVKTFQECADLVLEYHITDQKAIFTSHNQIMRVCLKIPEENDFPRLAQLLTVAYYWVDLAVLMKQSLAKSSLENLNKARYEAMQNQVKLSHQEQQEAAQKRREEKLKKEKESLTTPEARAKFDEKLKKKQAKSKVKLIKIK